MWPRHCDFTSLVSWLQNAYSHRSWGNFWDTIGNRVVLYWTSTDQFALFVFVLPPWRLSWKSIKKCDCESADRQTHRQTDRQTDRRADARGNDFITCATLWHDMRVLKAVYILVPTVYHSKLIDSSMLNILLSRSSRHLKRQVDCRCPTQSTTRCSFYSER